MVAIKLLFTLLSWILILNPNLFALPHIILLGSPGAGKGTMSQLLASSKGYLHIGSGDMLREEIKRGSELGSIIKKIFESNEIISDAMIIEMIKSRITDPLVQGKKIILEGFPENCVQAKFMEEYLQSLQIKDVCIVQVLVDPQVAIHRILNRKTCGQCGAPYNTKTNIPLNVNQCDGAMVNC